MTLDQINNLTYLQVADLLAQRLLGGGGTYYFMSGTKFTVQYVKP